MQQHLLRFLLLKLRPRKMEMHDRLASRAHADAAVVAVVAEKNQRRILRLLRRLRNRQLRRRLLPGRRQALRLDRVASASLARKRSTSFVAQLNRW